LNSIVKSGIIAQNGGAIFTVTPQQWLFGRNDTFLSQLLGATVPVSGVWTDFTKELGDADPVDHFTTGKADPYKYKVQLTYEGSSNLSKYFAPYSPPVKGSSLTFIGAYRLQNKFGKKNHDVNLLLWVPNVVRELQLIYSKEVTFKGINLFRYVANVNYETVEQSNKWNNPYDFVMDCQTAYTGGLYPFYLTFPGWTLVKEKEIFNDLVEGVDQDEKKWILFWDIEPISGIAMSASAPLQLSLPVGSLFSNWTQYFDLLGLGYRGTHIPTWAIIRTNSLSDKQASQFKKAVLGATHAQLGLTIALPLFGFLFILTGIILIIVRACGGGRGGDGQEFELRT